MSVDGEPESELTFVVDSADGETVFAQSGSAAEYLLDRGFADSDREPLWHLRWCLDRMAAGETMDVGAARVFREIRAL